MTRFQQYMEYRSRGGIYQKSNREQAMTDALRKELIELRTRIDRILQSASEAETRPAAPKQEKQSRKDKYRIKLKTK